MPELPEVETVRRGLLSHCLGQKINQVIIRQPKLRWPIPAQLPSLLQHHTINQVLRRGKYLLIPFPHGTLLIHLGMSGVLRILDPATLVTKHDHVDIELSTITLRFHDPRRFGCILWIEAGKTHPLLDILGPEPLSDDFNTDYLYQSSRHRATAVKLFLMNNAVVTGIGNIYCNETLFQAQIHPTLPAQRITKAQAKNLVDASKSILAAAIELGGTTIKDFKNSQGKPGYFTQHLQVYGREGQPCFTCQTPLQELRLNQRSTIFCPCCQKK